MFVQVQKEEWSSDPANCGLLGFFTQRANENHFDIRGVPRAARNVERTFFQRLEIHIPLAVACGDNQARDFVVVMIGMNQIGVRTVGQILIAKNQIHFLPGKHFFRLGSSRAADHIGGKALEGANEHLANFQLRRSYQNASPRLRRSLWRVVERRRGLSVRKRGHG
jgi:hypothetical protein